MLVPVLITFLVLFGDGSVGEVKDTLPMAVPEAVSECAAYAIKQDKTVLWKVGCQTPDGRTIGWFIHPSEKA